LVGVLLFAAAGAGAQNFVRNPDFEEPLGPDNWTVVYTAVQGGGANAPTNCGPYDFLIADRTAMAHKDAVPGTWDGHPYYWNKFGGHFAPNHSGLMHAYFRQVVSGLTPGSNYTCSAWIAQYTGNDNYLTKADVYLEALGGPSLTVSRVSEYVTNNVYNNPGNWKWCAVTNTASTNGQIEIRLHYNKKASIAQVWEYRNLNAFFDHVAVMPTGQPATPPPFEILSLSRSNHEVALTWETVRNYRYRVQATTDPLNPLSWTQFVRNPYVDPDFLATGASMTFWTNLLANDPAYDPAAPRYFRIRATNNFP